MNDFERINQPRVERVLQQLELVKKSAASSRTPLGEIADLYAPILDELSWLTDRRTAPAPAPAPVAQNHPDNALNVAREVPLRKAVEMMSIIATRIEQELWEQEQ